MTQTKARREWYNRYDPDRAVALSRDDWETPASVINGLEDIFGVDIHIDAAAEVHNRKAQHYFSLERYDDLTTAPFGYLGYDGMRSDWSSSLIRDVLELPANQPIVVFCNPPYHAEDMMDWADQHRRQWELHGVASLGLWPAHTDRPWYNYVGERCDGILNGRSRIQYEGGVDNKNRNTTGTIVPFWGLTPKLHAWPAKIYSVNFAGNGKHLIPELMF